jgi:hypothetical protein
MKPKSPCQVALGEFRVIAEHIGTRDLVQEFLAFRVFPTLKETCQEWLDTIEVMCNEILGNYSKKTIN